MPYRISDVELASRLSFFLWSSIPDDELLRRGRRRESSNDPAVLERAGRSGCWPIPKSRALVDNFAGQWLQLRNVRNVQPNSDAFPDFDDNLRQAFRRETELFFESIMREDRSVLDLLTRRLHVRQRAAGPALRDPEHLRQPVPPRHGDRRHAARPARPGQHPGGDVARRAHVAGRARQVDSRKHPRVRRCRRRRPMFRRSRRTTRARSRRRCASRWQSIAPTRSAPAATR